MKAMVAATRQVGELYCHERAFAMADQEGPYVCVVLLIECSRN